MARSTQRFVICIENKDGEDLEKKKVYQALPDAKAMRDGYIRVIDESGEDYLYPESYFVAVEISAEARDALSSPG